jgi:hypothetical protein
MDKVYQEIEYLDSTYADVLFTRDPLTGPFAENFGVTEEYLNSLNFHQFERYSDMTFAERYEGIPQKFDWTQELLDLINM